MDTIDARETIVLSDVLGKEELLLKVRLDWMVLFYERMEREYEDILSSREM